MVEESKTTVIEESRRKSIRWIGYFWLGGFICPIVVQGFGTTQVIFPNIVYLVKEDLLATIGLLYPLAAGLLILWVGLNVETSLRPVTVLALGLIPVMFSLTNEKDLITSSMNRFSSETVLMLLMMLSLIGIYVGSRLLATTGHAAGRLIGGLCGISFLALVLLPFGQGSKPLFFALFDIFKTGPGLGGGGSLYLLGVFLVAIFICYIIGALIAVLNIADRPTAQQTAVNSYKLVLYASLALPISFLLVVLFSGAGFAVIVTLLIKLTLLLGGIIGAIAVGLFDLLDQLLPKSVRGSDLTNR